jgi:lysozyme
MDNEKLAAELLRDEGLRLRLYTCTAGKTSIGVGRNLADRGISRAEAIFLMANDVDDAERDLARYLKCWSTLDDVRQRVLINMCFNLGIVRLLGFKQTLAAIERRDYAAAAAAMRDSKWATQVGARADRLARMMERGDDL